MVVSMFHIKQGDAVILIIKPTRYTNFSNLFLEYNSKFFGQFLCPSSAVFHCTHSNVICHTGLRSGSGRNYSQAVSKHVWHIPLLCVQWKTPDDGQRNCLKHVEFYSKNKLRKVVHIVGSILRIYHDVRSQEGQIWCCNACRLHCPQIYLQRSRMNAGKKALFIQRLYIGIYIYIYLYCYAKKLWKSAL